MEPRICILWYSPCLHLQKEEKQNFPLSVDRRVDAQYNCRRRVCRSAEELQSTDPHPSTEVLLSVDGSVDGSCTARRRIHRRTERKCPSFGSPPLATPWIIRHHLLQYLAGPKMPSKNKNRSMANRSALLNLHSTGDG